MGLRRVRLQGWETPLALLGVVILSYGLWIPWFGLFGNDVPYLWYYHLLGPWGPGEFASVDRPISALLYAVSTFLFGETVWLYHVFLLILRWLSGVLLWWLMGLVWPDRKREAALAAFLFVVYPGFRQNPVSLEFILHIFVLDMFLLSTGLMLLAALRVQPGPWWRYRGAGLLVLASTLLAGNLFFLEYFIGLEILRPIFLWIILRREGLRGRQLWQRLMLVWMPVLLMVAAFLFWRVVIFSFPTYKPVLLDRLREDPLSALAGLVQIAAKDTWTAFGAAWLQTLRLPEGRRSLLLALALGGAAAALVILLWWRSSKTVSPPAAAHWGVTLLGIGGLAMLAGGSIFWLTNIPVSLDFPWDRSTLSFMLGASLAVTGVLEMVLNSRARPGFAALLVALAVMMHFTNAREYRAEWRKLQDFFWQLTWRAPGLEPGTLALFDVIPLNRYSDTDLSAMLNWTYAPNLHQRQIPYKFFDLTLRLDTEYTGLPGLEKGLPVTHNHRGVQFSTTTDSLLVVHYDPPDCLKVFSPYDAALPGLSNNLARTLPLSNLDLIFTSAAPAVPPAQLGTEPAHGWCYSYQKAGLALQQGDPAAAAALGDEALASGLSPEDPAEWLPFIEAYLVSDQPEKARALSDEVRKDSRLQPALCATIRRTNTPGSVDLSNDLGCQP